MRILQLAILIFFISLSAFAQTKKPVVKPKPKVVTLVTKASLIAGKEIYETNCISCHLVGGEGVANLNPPLIKTSFVLGAKPALINIILNGMQGVKIDGIAYPNIMPSQDFLTDKEIADVLTYVRNNFGNKASAVAAAEVAAERKKQ